MIYHFKTCFVTATNLKIILNAIKYFSIGISVTLCNHELSEESLFLHDIKV